MREEKAAVIIPVYNHAGTVVEVIRKAASLQVPIYVVDDGSTDDTAACIRNIPDITVLRHPTNMGKGAALMTGFAAAAPVARWAVTIDADGQHNPQDAENLFRVVRSMERPIVVGCRQGMGDRHVPLASRFGRGFSNFWVRASGGPVMRDTQSGFRLYPLPEVLTLPVKARRFQFEVEVLVRAAWKGIPVREAPVGVVYAPGKERISHYRGFVDFWRNSVTFSSLIFYRWFLLPFNRLRGK